jgi:hypothetical protein
MTSLRRSTSPSVNASSVPEGGSLSSATAGCGEAPTPTGGATRAVEDLGVTVGDQQRREVPGTDQPQPPGIGIQFADEHGGELVVGVDVQQPVQLGQHDLDGVAWAR